MSFLNRSIPCFPKEKVILKPKEQKLVIVKGLFVEEISRMATVMLLDTREQITVMLKFKFIRNRVTLNLTNNTQETVTFDPKEMIGVLDLRSFGYYKIKQGVLQQNLNKHYHFKTADTVCNQFNKFVNMLKREEAKCKEKYPWLDENDERKYMTNREILDKYINMDKSCLTKEEKEDVRNLLYE